ncbi:hypothetical protein [Leucobacter ruminantium]|uniref:DUF4232 domain-containing protein n=1 Tax=Leucobacter ruminantium TaxID=1289170 RepID=A0A939RXQ4_9MICO|nr:hypothetical protein [Leucobacter ruminantium]MBO1806392.1 hypothetical protein [Leucobacter ruminantium]
MSKPRDTPDGEGDRANRLDALRNPVGPKDRKVYIRRRIAVLAVLLAVVAVVVLVFVKPGSSGGARDSAQVEVPNDLPRDAEPAEGDAPAACSAEQITVTPITDKTAYAEGELPLLSLSVENTGADACTADLGTAGMTFTITSGEDQVWRSVDCQKDPTNQAVILDPGKPLTTDTVQWDRTRSTPDTCEVPREPVAAGGASYHLAVAAGGATSTDTVQFILN